jgi:hypothetical protein
MDAIGPAQVVFQETRGQINRQNPMHRRNSQQKKQFPPAAALQLRTRRIN